MRIFLSYASEDRDRAEEIALALTADGHTVFFDRTKLLGGEAYHGVIRDEIERADRVIFLITPYFVDSGSYTLTEVQLTQTRWAHPKGHVLPVLLAPTPIDRIPAYLKAVTLEQPAGSAAAEIAAQIERLGAGHRWARWSLVVFATAALAAGLWLWKAQPSGFVSTIQESDFVTRFVLPNTELQRVEYSLDEASPLAGVDAEVVDVARVAFGGLPDDTSAWSITVSLQNTTQQPIQLDVTPRFFSLTDDQGQEAELVYFSGSARNELLAPRLRRMFQLIYRSPRGWEGKRVSAHEIRFHIEGLLPLLSGTWTFRPLAMAN